MKAALRRRVPPKYWSLARDSARSGLRAIENALTTLMAGALKVLPSGVSLDLRERLALQRPLDYAPALIALRITSRLERDLRLRSCEKEPETVEWIEQTFKPGDVLYDIGANVGAYALIAAQSTRGNATVYAFEPGYATFPNLVANIFLNRWSEAIIPFPVALGAKTALMEFHYATLDAGGAMHAGLADAGTTASTIRKQTLPSYRLDDFVELLRLQSPTHMKIDVDGGELRVLQGGARMLESPNLRWILIEIDTAGNHAQDIRNFLMGYGFNLKSDHAHAGGTTHNWIFTRQGLSPMASAVPDVPASDVEDR